MLTRQEHADLVGSAHQAGSPPIEEGTSAPVAGDGGSPSSARTEQHTVPVYAEELVARIKSVEIGRVRVRKEVVTEMRTIEVPIRRERVVVEAELPDDVPIYRGSEMLGTDAGRYGADEYVVPVLEDDIVIETRPVVVEEVVIRRLRVPRTERIEGVVRREEPFVEMRGNLSAAHDEAVPGPAWPK